MIVSLIAAVARNGVIGVEGDLPWRLPGDLAFFKRTTMGHPVIMGRRTWNEVGRPLPGRTNVVLTRDPSFEAPGARVVASLDEALAPWRDTEEEVFVIGGGAVYRLALPVADRLWLTRIHADVEGDTTFPEVSDSEWRRVWSEEHPADPKHEWPFTFERWEREAGRTGFRPGGESEPRT